MNVFNPFFNDKRKIRQKKKENQETKTYLLTKALMKKNIYIYTYTSEAKRRLNNGTERSNSGLNLPFL